MRRLGLALAALLLSVGDGSAAPLPVPGLHPLPARPVAPPGVVRRRRFFFPPLFREPRRGVRRPRLRPLPEPMEPAPPPLPSAPPSAAPDMLPPLPHGFQLTVPVGRGAPSARPGELVRYVDVGPALAACFAAPAGLAWGAVTLRVAFRRDGTVFGEPRIPYSDAATQGQKSELAQSVLTALKRCTPLPLSPALGAAIAGEIFAIRFVNQDHP